MSYRDHYDMSLEPQCRDVLHMGQRLEMYASWKFTCHRGALCSKRRVTMLRSSRHNIVKICVIVVMHQPPSLMLQLQVQHGIYT